MHRRPRLALLTATALVVVVVAACGPSGSDPLASFNGSSLTIQARDLTFAPVIVTAPANTPLRLILDNTDVGVPHNLHVFQGDTDIGQSATIVGPGLGAVELPALAPGRYQFACTIHPNMIGTIIVSPGAPAGPSDPAEAPPSDGPTSPVDAASDAPAGS